MADIINLKTAYRTCEIPDDHIDRVLGLRILRVIGDEDWMAKSGFRERPFLCLNRKQGVHHAYRGPQPAFRARTYARDWEGEGDDPPEETERARLRHWLEAHPQLALWVSDEFMTGPERKQYERACLKLARDMGQPVDELKVQILQLTISAATAEQKDAAVEMLAEATKLDRERLTAVTSIGNGLRWHNLAILREIVNGQELMHAAHNELTELYSDHCKLTDTMNGREAHFARVLELTTRLKGAKDRPYRGLARRDQRDLRQYYDQVGLGLMTGSFQAGAMCLRRPLMGHQQFAFARRIDAVLFRLALAQSRRGSKGKEQLAKGHSELMAIKTELNQLSPPGARVVLENDPYWRVLGLIYEADVIWKSDNSDMNAVKESLRAAVAAFG